MFPQTPGSDPYHDIFGTPTTGPDGADDSERSDQDPRADFFFPLIVWLALQTEEGGATTTPKQGPKYLLNLRLLFEEVPRYLNN